MRYIAFLRGVNVGGKNKLSMSELKSAFIEHGFEDVSTYINSGNILFSTDEANVCSLKEQCEAIIADYFELDIQVGVITGELLQDAIEHAPDWWNHDEDAKHNVIFVLPPATVEEIAQEVGAVKPEYEKVDWYENVIFWSAPRQTFSHTRWSKIVGTKAYRSITIRNANTAIKLAELVRESESVPTQQRTGEGV